MELNWYVQNLFLVICGTQSFANFANLAVTKLPIVANFSWHLPYREVVSSNYELRATCHFNVSLFGNFEIHF